MTLQLVPAQAHHVPEIGRICYQAFQELQSRHGFPCDWPSVAAARQELSMLVQRPDFYGVVALVDGDVAGSSFMLMSDAIAGIGPISIDPAFQGQGIGRSLMLDAIRHARDAAIPIVRLQQDAFNAPSLALYASLGFDVVTATAVMEPPAGSGHDETVRPLTAADLPGVDALTTRMGASSRRAEIAANLAHGFTGLARERDGRVTGYHLPGVLGHGLAETNADALALLLESGRSTPPGMATFFCPLSQGALYRDALKAGCRMVKIMNYMSLGRFDPPNGVWLPSVLC